MKEKVPSVSVIITTKNEEENIENCLKNVKSQSYPQEKVEIIVVDNNSTNKTKGVAKKFTDKVYNKGPERSAQRNFGVEKASGKYILYLDADMILSKDVISECVEKCLPRRKPKAFLRGENEDCIALYIPERIVGNSFWVKVRDFERSFYNATVIDCVRFIRKDKFLEIGGFDESLTGPEDWDFDRRIKTTGKVDIINAPLYHNEESFNLRKYLEKKGYYSKSFDKYVQKWGRDDPIIRKQLGFQYRLFGVFLENGKWKRLLKHPLLALEMYFLKFVIGFYYLKGV